ncbi:MAG: methionine ABC transporter ATP-binding protein [Burkholderiaceae bacterium]|jgi:D-methionine transport system ATP-binding protein|nr:methionine ABC transporter ATP-binding protein [Burkholderiaceae bacterium]
MIELTGIHLRYPGKGGAALHALRGIDLSIGAGEVFGIIGKSGAGKSSLVRTINLLNRPTEGQVRVGGVDLMTLGAAGLRAARREIGMVFQHFNLLAARTVYANVALPLELQGLSGGAIRERVMPLLELVGLAPLADRYPAQISGGQKQRVGIARALASRPKVLLSDEATSALDPETTRAILALLQRINRELGLTIVLIAHQMQVIRQIAQRVAVMEAGRIVEQGTVLEVFTHPRQAITRSLIEEVLPQRLPEGVLAHVAARRATLPPGHDGRLLRLTYAGERAEQPLLSRLIRVHGVDANILHGQVDEIQGQAFGVLAVYVSGLAASVQAVAAGLAEAEVQVRDVTQAPDPGDQAEV